MCLFTPCCASINQTADLIGFVWVFINSVPNRTSSRPWSISLKSTADDIDSWLKCELFNCLERLWKKKRKDLGRVETVFKQPPPWKLTRSALSFLFCCGGLDLQISDIKTQLHCLEREKFVFWGPAPDLLMPDVFCDQIRRKLLFPGSHLCIQ